jgi:hypothetical protein
MRLFNVWVFAVIVGLAGCHKDARVSGTTPTPPPAPPTAPPVTPPDNHVPEPPPSNLPAYPFNFDVETPGGILIQTNGHPIPPVEDIDRWYNEVQQCLADWFPILYPDKTFVFVEPPPVVIVEDTRTLCGTGATGIYCRNYLIPFVGLNNDWAQFFFKWKHEFEHHILTANGFDEALQLSHQPTQFWGIGGCEYQ